MGGEIFQNMVLIYPTISFTVVVIFSIFQVSKSTTLPRSFRAFKKKLYGPFFYGWGSTASRLEPLRGCSLLFTTKFAEIPGTHFIDLDSLVSEFNIQQLLYGEDIPQNVWKEAKTNSGNIQINCIWCFLSEIKMLMAHIDLKNSQKFQD